MRPFRLTLFWIILCITAPAWAAPVEKSGEKTHEGVAGKVSVTASEKEISVADSLTLTVEITAPPGYTARAPEFEEYGFSTSFNERSQRFRVTDVTEVEKTPAPDGGTMLRQAFTLEPWLSGDYSILPLMVAFFKDAEPSDTADAGDAEPDADLTMPAFNVMTDGFRIDVTPLTEERKELADLFGQSDYRMEKLIKRERRKEEMSDEELRREEEQAKEEAMALKKRRFPMWIVWILLGAGLLTGLVWFARRKKIHELFKQPRPPAHEVAYQALQRLKEKNLPGSGRIKEFYYELSYILREYIGDRFGIRAVNQTTEEFFHHLLRSNPFDDKNEGILREFSESADTVKYSLHRPDRLQAEESFRIAKSFVDATREENG
ncbi:MAG: hypothetical protein GY859_40735 [Desulfobacterales bacterium]|nr:hypothetical protein [Desulfobacterales bacterium]